MRAVVSYSYGFIFLNEFSENVTKKKGFRKKKIYV